MEIGFTQSLLYLLLLYAVLDNGNTLNLTTGVLIAAGILLFNCFNNQCCNSTNRTTTGRTIFSDLNGFI